MVQELTGLVYSGHADLADRFLLESRWSDPRVEEDFRRAFWARLRRSPWFEVLEVLNPSGLPRPGGSESNQISVD